MAQCLRSSPMRQRILHPRRVKHTASRLAPTVPGQWRSSHWWRPAAPAVADPAVGPQRSQSAARAAVSSTVDDDQHDIHARWNIIGIAVIDVSSVLGGVIDVHAVRYGHQRSVRQKRGR
jgi:hypothetical protein